MKEGLVKLKNFIARRKELPYDYWFSATEKLYKSMGEEPSPIQIRAQAIITAFGLPSGQVSALETNTNDNRVNLEKDKVIAKLLTNKAGVVINRKTGIVSLDPRDIYPGGLPPELEEVLDPKTTGIINVMYESETSTREKFGDTKDDLEAEELFNYFRLPGGVDLLLMGYVHHRDWHENHQEFLAKIGTYNPAVIGIEGFTNIPFGKSLSLRWVDISIKIQHSDYDKLMKQLVESGFTGLFTEVDTRDKSKIKMDNDNHSFPSLPKEFFQKYFEFLEKEQPRLASTLISPDGLKLILRKQSTTNNKVNPGLGMQYKKGKRHFIHPYIKEDGGVSTAPTGMELGQFLFSDALAAIKLHMTAKLIADGHIPKGPIVDFEGAYHLPSKAFFIRNPEYAVEIVLRTLGELMAGEVKEKDNIKEIYDVFDNPNWTEIVKEIAKLRFSKVDTTQGNSVEIGDKQYPINNVPVDFLEVYDINPAEVIPSDSAIHNVIQKLSKQEK